MFFDRAWDDVRLGIDILCVVNPRQLKRCGVGVLRVRRRAFSDRIEKIDFPDLLSVFEERFDCTVSAHGFLMLIFHRSGCLENKVFVFRSFSSDIHLYVVERVTYAEPFAHHSGYHFGSGIMASELDDSSDKVQLIDNGSLSRLSLNETLVKIITDLGPTSPQYVFVRDAENWPSGGAAAALDYFIAESSREPEWIHHADLDADSGVAMRVLWWGSPYSVPWHAQRHVSWDSFLQLLAQKFGEWERGGQNQGQGCPLCDSPNNYRGSFIWGYYNGGWRWGHLVDIIRTDYGVVDWPAGSPTWTQKLRYWKHAKQRDRFRQCYRRPEIEARSQCPCERYGAISFRVGQEPGGWRVGELRCTGHKHLPFLWPHEWNQLGGDTLLFRACRLDEEPKRSLQARVPGGPIYAGEHVGNPLAAASKSSYISFSRDPLRCLYYLLLNVWWESHGVGRALDAKIVTVRGAELANTAYATSTGHEKHWYSFLCADCFYVISGTKREALHWGTVCDECQKTLYFADWSQECVVEPVLWKLPGTTLSSITSLSDIVQASPELGELVRQICDLPMETFRGMGDAAWGDLIARSFRRAFSGWADDPVVRPGVWTVAPRSNRDHIELQRRASSLLRQLLGVGTMKTGPPPISIGSAPSTLVATANLCGGRARGFSEQDLLRVIWSECGEWPSLIALQEVPWEWQGRKDLAPFKLDVCDWWEYQSLGFAHQSQSGRGRSRTIWPPWLRGDGRRIRNRRKSKWQQHLHRYAVLRSVDFDGRPLSLLCVHLEGGRYEDYRFREGSRAATMKHLLHFSHYPDIVAGDFNGSPSSELSREALGGCGYGPFNLNPEAFLRWRREPFRVLEGAGYRNVTPSELLRPTCYFGDAVDHIYIRGDRLEVVGTSIVKLFNRSDRCEVSDHHSVVARIRWR